MTKRTDIQLKVCGISNNDDLRQVAGLDVDMIGIDCRKCSPRVMKMISSQAGTLPDYASLDISTLEEKPVRAGVFQDDMPQDIVTRIYNYGLKYVQLSGDESEIMIDNLRRTLVPDICESIGIIKTIRIGTAADFAKCKPFEGVADIFLFEGISNEEGKEDVAFDWSLLSEYKGSTPFIVGGNISIASVEALRELSHPKLCGVNLDMGFEKELGSKDIDALKKFIEVF